MAAATRSRISAQIFLAAVFGIALLLARHRAKAGRSITVGLELDISGFDPLEGRGVDTSRNGVCGDFDTLADLDDKGEARPKLAFVDHSEDFKTWTFKLRPGSNSTMARHSNAEAVRPIFDRQKDRPTSAVVPFTSPSFHDVAGADELTATSYNLERSAGEPARRCLRSRSSNNAMQSPTAWKTKGDDYNRNPVGTGPYILKSLDAGRSHGARKESGLLEQGSSYFDRDRLEAAAGCAVRFAACNPARPISCGTMSRCRQYRRPKRFQMTVHTYIGSGAQVYISSIDPTRVAARDIVRVRQDPCGVRKL